jgi:protein phosphatase
MLEDQQLLETLLNSTTLSVKCENLIKQANEAGGKDNITVLAAAVQDEVEVAER